MNQMINPVFVLEVSDKLDNPQRDTEIQQNGIDMPTNGNTDIHQNGNGKPVAEPHNFDEAITLTGIGRFHYLVLVVCGICFTSVMTEIMGVSFIIPSLRCDLESTITEQSILTSASFIGIVLGSQIMGFLADTWGRIRTLRYALLLGGIATIISAFSVNIWMLISFRLINGLFISGGQACVFTAFGEFHGNKTRVKYMTWLSGFSPLSLIYIPLLAIFILPIEIESIVFGMKFSSWRILLLANSLISFLSVIGLFILPETPKYVMVQGDHDRTMDILRKMFVKNTGRSPDDYPVKCIVVEAGGNSLSDVRGFKDAMKMVWSQTAPLFYKERYLHTINICTIMFLLYLVAQGLFMWFPTFLNELISNAGSGLDVCPILNNMEQNSGGEDGVACAQEVDIVTFEVMGLIGIGFCVFYVVVAFAINFIGKKNLIMGWVLLVAVCLLGLHWISNFGLAAIALAMPASVGYCGSIINTISMEFFPTKINAMALSLNMTIGRLGAAIGTNVIGQMLFSSCDLVLWILLLFSIAVIVMSYFLPERKHK